MSMYNVTTSAPVIAFKRSRYFLLGETNEEQTNPMFHLNKDDYFGTLASALDLLAQMLEKCQQTGKPPLAQHVETLRQLKDEISFLKDKCLIVEK